MKNLIFTVLIPGTVAVYIPVFIFSHSTPTLSLISVVGAALVLVGTSIYFWCLWGFAVAGRGTPAPIDPPKTLVEKGLYKYSRNPMYVGVISAIAGWAIFFQSLELTGYGVCVGSVFQLFVCFYEEPHLRRTFGDSYEHYCNRVSRWISLRRQ